MTDGNGATAGRGSARSGDGPVAQGQGNGAATPTAHLPALIEGVLFVSDGPVGVASLARALDVSASRVETALRELQSMYHERGVRLQRTNGNVQLVSAPEAADAIQRYLGLEQSSHLSRAALETLSIVAYRQPVTRPEIDDVRGVNSEGVLRTVIARGLVEPVGRRATVGHPIEYGTTFQFLEYFGLTGLEDLPPVELLVDPREAADPGAVEANGSAIPRNGAGPDAPDDA